MSRARAVTLLIAVTATAGACGRGERVPSHGVPVTLKPAVPDSVSATWHPGFPAYIFRFEEVFDTATDVTGLALRIERSGLPDRQVSVPGGLVPITDAVGDSFSTADNLVRSRYLYLTARLRGAGNTPMLLVFGQAFASDPGSLVVLALNSSGQPVEVLRHATFEPTALEDLDGDGVPELIGKRSLSQTWGKCFTTYDPYAVYRLTGTAQPHAVYDIALSRAYNLAHYAGWAGPNGSEAYAVVTCGGGRPRVMSTKEATRRFGGP